ncbi:MAG: hypothetical protein RRY22_04950 [Bacilli bacterium]
MGDEKNNNNTWGILIVLFLLFIVFGRGFIGGRGEDSGIVGNNLGCGCGCGRVSNCEVERQEIIDSYNTQLNTINQGIITRADMQNGFQRLADQSRGQWDAQQGEKIFDLKMENQSLKQMVYADNKFNEINRRLDDISCNTPKRPPFYATGVQPCGYKYPPCNDCNIA